MEIVEVDEHHHVVPSLAMHGAEGCVQETTRSY